MSSYFFYRILLFTSLIFGTTMGAYFCTIEYRIRNDLPLITSDCFCPSCGHKLSIFHQIPVLSYLFLRGHCHYCHSRISPRYPLTEALFLIYYSLTYWIFHQTPIIYLLMWYVFITLTLIFKGKHHTHALIRGIIIMSLYHISISVLYLILYSATGYSSGF